VEGELAMELALLSGAAHSLLSLDYKVIAQVFLLSFTCPQHWHKVVHALALQTRSSATLAIGCQTVVATCFNDIISKGRESEGHFPTHCSTSTISSSSSDGSQNV